MPVTRHRRAGGIAQQRHFGSVGGSVWGECLGECLGGCPATDGRTRRRRETVGTASAPSRRAARRRWIWRQTCRPPRMAEVSAAHPTMPP
jgi:hypothetical protein